MNIKSTKKSTKKDMYILGKASVSRVVVYRISIFTCVIIILSYIHTYNLADYFVNVCILCLY